MVSYKIKHHTPEELQQIDQTTMSGEYWQDIPDSVKDDLDFEDINEINQFSDDNQKSIPLWVKSAIAFIVVICFALWVLNDMFSFLPDLGFLKDSAKLAQNESLDELRQAVVTIESFSSSGTGFNVRADGLIITNRHVVDNGGILSISFADGTNKIYTASDWVVINDVDLAVIDIDGFDLPYVKMTDSEVVPGDEIIFIGNPLGFDWTISEGTINRIIYLNDTVPVIYFNGPVRSGSSGSPVFNAESEVVGVVFASFTDQEDSGLAIPISYILDYLEEIE